jgi:hypothetical protein
MINKEAFLKGYSNGLKKLAVLEPFAYLGGHVMASLPNSVTKLLDNDVMAALAMPGAGGVLGAGLGAGIGHFASKDKDKTKNTQRGALIGGGIGTGLGALETYAIANNPFDASDGYNDHLGQPRFER